MIDRLAVEFPQTALHEPGNVRPCVHLLSAMPRIMVVARGPVERLNFQPRIVSKLGRNAIIAARTDDILTLSVDLIGPLEMRHPHRGRGQHRDHRILHHWRFELRELNGRPDRLLAVQFSSPG